MRPGRPVTNRTNTRRPAVADERRQGGHIGDVTDGEVLWPARCEVRLEAVGEVLEAIRMFASLTGH